MVWAIPDDDDRSLEGETAKLNLGCPRYCEGYVCVDLMPKDSHVVKADALDYLREDGEVLDEIKTENMLEHLPNVQEFLKLCHSRLKEGGRIVVVTDNAEWLPFYAPFSLPGTGIGAHAIRYYSQRFNAVHLSIFSKMHLWEHLNLAGFQDIEVRRLWEYAGARLQGIGTR